MTCFFRNQHDALFNATKPYQYVGGEFLSYNKDWNSSSVKFAFVFPDKYEIGISNLGVRIIYDRVNSYKRQVTNETEKSKYIYPFLADRAYAPEPDFKPEFLYGVESKRTLKDFDGIGFSLQYELSYPTVLKMLEMSGVGVKNSERKENEPRQGADERHHYREPHLPPGAGHLPHPGGHHFGHQRHRHGPGGHLRANLLQRGGFPGAQADPGQGAHPVLHRDHRHLRDHRAADDAGFPAFLVRVPGHLHPADRGQLHHPGPRGSLCQQERPAALRRGRPGHGPRLHLRHHSDRHRARADRQRLRVRHQPARRVL